MQIAVAPLPPPGISYAINILNPERNMGKAGRRMNL
jgi:hypothetical protein